MFYYNVNYHVTSAFDINPLMIVGFVQVYTNEAKTDYLTDMPFNALGLYITFAECPQDTVENLTAYVTDKANTAMNIAEVQDKLNTILVAKNLGLI